MVDIQTKIPSLALDSGSARLAFSSQAGHLEFVRGEDRLQGGNGGTNSGITGANAHAAVRMHAYPVSGSFWAFCPKTKTPHFQRWKVAH